MIWLILVGGQIYHLNYMQWWLASLVVHGYVWWQLGLLVVDIEKERKYEYVKRRVNTDERKLNIQNKVKDKILSLIYVT